MCIILRCIIISAIDNFNTCKDLAVMIDKDTRSLFEQNNSYSKFSFHKWLNYLSTRHPKKKILKKKYTSLFLFYRCRILCLTTSKMIIYSPVPWLQCDCSFLPGAAVRVSYDVGLVSIWQSFIL